MLLGLCKVLSSPLGLHRGVLNLRYQSLVHLQCQKPLNMAYSQSGRPFDRSYSIKSSIVDQKLSTKQKIMAKNIHTDKEKITDCLAAGMKSAEDMSREPDLESLINEVKVLRKYAEEEFKQMKGKIGHGWVYFWVILCLIKVGNIDMETRRINERTSSIMTQTMNLSNEMKKLRKGEHTGYRSYP